MNGPFAAKARDCNPGAFPSVPPSVPRLNRCPPRRLSTRMSPELRTAAPGQRSKRTAAAGGRPHAETVEDQVFHVVADHRRPGVGPIGPQSDAPQLQSRHVAAIETVGRQRAEHGALGIGVFLLRDFGGRLPVFRPPQSDLDLLSCTFSIGWPGMPVIEQPTLPARVATMLPSTTLRKVPTPGLGMSRRSAAPRLPSRRKMGVVTPSMARLETATFSSVPPSTSSSDSPAIPRSAP